MRKKAAKPLPELGCHNCKFWQKDDDDVGNCRRYPPAVLHDESDGVFCVWPWTEPESWCGEHSVKLQ